MHLNVLANATGHLYLKACKRRADVPGELCLPYRQAEELKDLQEVKRRVLGLANQMVHASLFFPEDPIYLADAEDIHRAVTGVDAHTHDLAAA